MHIIHLSDTHCGTGTHTARMNLLVDDILSFGDPANTVVVHTGDLIDTSSLAQMEEGRTILQRIADSGRTVLLSPGNHDYGDKWRMSAPQAAVFKQTLKDFIFHDGSAVFPVVTLTDEVAFIGLDSNQGEMGWWSRWFAEGSLGHHQLERLNKILDRPDVKKRTVVLYMHHQPFMGAFSVKPDVADKQFLSHLMRWHNSRYLRLEDAYTFVQVIRDRIDILLFGHRHLTLDYQAEAVRYGFKMALDGSSSTSAKMDTDRMRYRVIDTQAGTYDVRFVNFPPGDKGQFSII